MHRQFSQKFFSHIFRVYFDLVFFLYSEGTNISLQKTVDVGRKGRKMNVYEAVKSNITAGRRQNTTDLE